mmetsp:Transcript_4541/g.11422  ORF Transcript_4541/g.11422 Transcript_4541/m.11422 type:complete len:244 (+) Transcript_4541:165-896(+)
MVYPTMPTLLTGFLNSMMLKNTATAPLALPSTCRVSGDVHFVTRKLVRFTANAMTQLSSRIHANLGLSLQFATNTPNTEGSITVVATTSTPSATGDMYSSRLSESSFSFSLVSNSPCSTDFRARANVALKHARNPHRWNSGSLLLARTMPSTMGTRVPYTSMVSFWRMMNSDSSAVKKGVVAPMAWLKDTGMKRRDTLPPTTEVTNTTASTATLMKCRRLLMPCLGTNPQMRHTRLRKAHITM